jgi:hypothetical protein
MTMGIHLWTKMTKGNISGLIGPRDTLVDYKDQGIHLCTNRTKGYISANRTKGTFVH